jgi:hypothetical protein
MQQPSDDTKANKRILIHPAMPEVNPLLRMLERKGADVLEGGRLSRLHIFVNPVHDRF